MSSREKFFECTLVSDEEEYRFSTRAWTATEAEEHMRHSLRASGIRKAGTLLVRDPDGTTLRTSTYLVEPLSSSAGE